MRSCSFCSLQTVETQRVREGGKSHQNYTASADGLNCTKCQRFAWRFCLEDIIEVIELEHTTKDKWYEEVNAYLNGVLPISFIGHCCEWRLKKKTKMESKQQREEVAASRPFDGHLFLPEYAF
jgi:hypothetical protein